MESVSRLKILMVNTQPVWIPIQRARLPVRILMRASSMPAKNQRNECVQVQQRLQQGHDGIEQQHEAAGPVQAAGVQFLLGLQEMNQ